MPAPSGFNETIHEVLSPIFRDGSDTLCVCVPVKGLSQHIDQSIKHGQVISYRSGEERVTYVESSQSDYEHVEVEVACFVFAFDFHCIGIPS